LRLLSDVRPRQRDLGADLGARARGSRRSRRTLRARRVRRPARVAARAPLLPGREVHSAGDDRARHRQPHRRQAVRALPAREAGAAARMTLTVDSPPRDRLRAILAELADLHHAETVVDWDSRVSMPPDGAEARAQVAATLTRLMHERFVSEEVGGLLEELDGVEDEEAAALVRVTRREWNRASRVPAELAAELAHAAGVAVAAWDRAKAASDFESFAPHFERQLELKRRYIDCFPATKNPYDLLLDEY